MLNNVETTACCSGFYNGLNLIKFRRGYEGENHKKGRRWLKKTPVNR